MRRCQWGRFLRRQCILEGKWESLPCQYLFCIVREECHPFESPPTKEHPETYKCANHQENTEMTSCKSCGGMLPPEPISKKTLQHG